MNPAPGFRKYPQHRVETRPSTAHVRMDRLARTSHGTHCPFKGDASYFSVVGGPENGAWSYEAPYDEMLAIKERLAFYPDKFEIEPSAS